MTPPPRRPPALSPTPCGVWGEMGHRSLQEEEEDGAFAVPAAARRREPSAAAASARRRSAGSGAIFSFISLHNSGCGAEPPADSSGVQWGKVTPRHGSDLRLCCPGNRCPQPSLGTARTAGLSGSLGTARFSSPAHIRRRAGAVSREMPGLCEHLLGALHQSELPNVTRERFLPKSSLPDISSDPQHLCTQITSHLTHPHLGPMGTVSQRAQSCQK